MANNTLYYPFLPKGGSGDSFKTVSSGAYASALAGDLQIGEYPYTSSLNVEYVSGISFSSRKRIYSLKNSLNRSTNLSNHFAVTASQWDKETQDIKLISIPSIFYGSSIQKGSVELSYYVSGTLIGTLKDSKLNGELIQSAGTASTHDGKVAGVVLYNQGFILLTGSWDLHGTFTEDYYKPTAISDSPRWLHWGSGLNQTSGVTISSSFDLNFHGVNYIPTVTMFAHANKGEINHSNNPTYVKYGETSLKPAISSSRNFKESDIIEIKNVTKYGYENYSGSLEKQTYITKICIYDDKKNIIAIAKLAKPIRKSENRDFTFKLKLDI